MNIVHNLVKIIRSNLVYKDTGGIILSNFVPIYEYGLQQQNYCKKIHNLYNSLKPNKKPIAFIKTYGCQQNVSDSEKYRGMLLEMGFKMTEDQNEADVVLFNTCAIRENAENKVFGNIGWLKNIKKSNPDLFVILCGCMTEQKSILEKIRTTYPFVDLVFGTHSMNKFPELFYAALENKGQKRKNLFISEKEDFIIENIPIKRTNNIKAFLSIMYGCNNFCSYCIVPYVRGRERSRNPEEIVTEFKNLLKAGYKDITLLGQNVNSYGKGLEKPIDFPDLLKLLDGFEGEYRVRFMTSHPKDATEKLFEIIANSRHIVHHIHLPVQCGSDRILKEMNRKYTKNSYLKIIDYARKKIPDITFTSDVIVGFPGETHDDFLETVALIKKIGFSSLFTFIYSPRESTPAASLPDNIPKAEKTNWLLELLKIQEGISEKFCKKMIGNKLRVLCESFDNQNACILCRTDGNIIVEASGDKSMIGKFLDVEITDSKKETLKGKII